MRLTLQWIGRRLTRVLLSPRRRSRPLALALYGRAYLIGKWFAEPRERAFLRAQVHPGMVVFDIGANVGFYTLRLARQVGSGGRVHAFEPDPLSFDILRQRVSAKAPGNVELRAVAVGEREGTVALRCGALNRADNRIHGSHAEGEVAESVEVPLVTLDGYCAAHRVERLDAVKMDVQGAEVEALRGFQDALRRLRPSWLLVELSPQHLRGAGATAEQLWQLLAAARYRPWGFDRRGRAFPIADTAAFAAVCEGSYTDVWARRVEEE